MLGSQNLAADDLGASMWIRRFVLNPENFFQDNCLMGIGKLSRRLWIQIDPLPSPESDLAARAILAALFEGMA
jgi:hypothetical protein